MDGKTRMEDAYMIEKEKTAAQKGRARFCSRHTNDSSSTTPYPAYPRLARGYQFRYEFWNERLCVWRKLCKLELGLAVPSVPGPDVCRLGTIGCRARIGARQ